MKKTVIHTLFIVFALFASNQAAAQGNPGVKLGAILSLSGGLEQWCGYIRQGIELAASEESPIKVDIIFEDDHSIDKTKALTAAQKLIQLDKVDLLFSWTASTVPVLAPVAARSQTPLLVGAYDDNVAKGGPYVFGGFVNYELVPREIARFFIKKGAHRLGLVMAADDWSQNFEAPFKDEVQKLGGDLVFSETVLPNEKDTRSLILKLKRNKVDGLLAPLYGDSLYSLLKEARELHFSGMIHVGDGMFEEDLKTVGESAEGVYASQIWLKSDELSAAFRKRFGAGVNALQLGLVASGYDGVKHIQAVAAQVLKDKKIISRQSLQEGLKTFQSGGYLGKLMYGAPPSQAGEIIMVVKEGRYIAAE